MTHLGLDPIQQETHLVPLDTAIPRDEKRVHPPRREAC